MQIIEGNALAKMCDYSFGDHHVVWDKNLKGDYKVANFSNAEFLVKCKDFEGKVMTVFIDNIRLYPRDLEFSGAHAQADASFIAYLMQYNDLLNLCRQFPNNKFIIFTSHEDTPIDDKIDIPPNVLAIYAVNGLTEKVKPFPIGLQREIGQGDERLEILAGYVARKINPYPDKLLYINCGIERNLDREPLRKFETNDWVTTRFDKDSKFFPYERYNEFLDEILSHKFMVCPPGHGMDCHRNWETLYMRRVPIMKDHPYFRQLMDGFPVLFVTDWLEVTRELLEGSDQLYQEAQSMDMKKLDLEVLFNKAINENNK